MMSHLRYTLVTGLLVTMVLTFVGVVHAAEPTVVKVKKNQTLNEAIDEVNGAVKVILPAGVTEHDAAITRNTTVVIEGQGEEVSTLKPARSRMEDGVQLIGQNPRKPYRGDLVLKDFTYDRNYVPGRRVISSKNTDYNYGHRKFTRPVDEVGGNIIYTVARGDVVVENFSTFHFNRSGKQIVLSPQGKRTNGSPMRCAYVGFHNATIDYKKDGGIRNRGGRWSGSIGIKADRFVFDEKSVFQLHSQFDADPEKNLVPVSKMSNLNKADEVNAAPLAAFSFSVWEYAGIHGTVAEADYSPVRSGNARTEDAVIEITGDFPRTGFGDAFWCSVHKKFLPEGVEVGGHLIYDGVRLTTHPESGGDRGFKAAGPWERLIVRDCYVSGRIACIESRNPDGAARKGTIKVTDTTLRPSDTGLTIYQVDEVDQIKVDNLVVTPSPQHEEGYFARAVSITTGGEGGPHMISNVLANDYLGRIVSAKTTEDTKVHTSNLHGRQATPESVVESAKPLASFPRRSLTIDGKPEVEDLEPIVTARDGLSTNETVLHEDNIPDEKQIEKIEVYMTATEAEGIFLTCIVADSELKNGPWKPDKGFRGDAVQFGIAPGRPGQSNTAYLYDLAKVQQYKGDTPAPENGMHVYRRTNGPNPAFPEHTGLITVPKQIGDGKLDLAVAYDEKAERIVYEFQLPWVHFGVDTPPIKDLSIDLAIADGWQRRNTGSSLGSAWPSPYEGVKGATLYGKGVVWSRSYKWVQYSAK